MIYRRERKERRDDENITENLVVMTLQGLLKVVTPAKAGVQKA